jgi:hypothetical protein
MMPGNTGAICCVSVNLIMSAGRMTLPSWCAGGGSHHRQIEEVRTLSEAYGRSDRVFFEKTLVHGVQVVGFGFFPTNATEFVEVLNRTVQRDMACA